MTKKKLLLCMPDLPFPARKNGISIRYYPIIMRAREHFDIHLLVVANNGAASETDIEGLNEAKSLCSEVSLYCRKPTKVSLGKKIFTRITSLIPTRTPFPEVRYDEEEIASFIARSTKAKTYDVALCVLIPYQPLIKEIVSAKFYSLDVIDSPYSTSVRKTEYSLIKKYDSWLVKIWERRIIRSVDRASYISPLDRTLGAGLPADSQKVIVIPNGIFLQDYTEEKVDFGCNTIGYLGHMGYPPNIKAALRLHRIFQSRKHEMPNTKLVIIGRDPAQEIRALGQEKDVIVTGTVDNIWPYINGVDIFSFPMEIGSGQQNKLLEAMGAGKLVISSSLGNSGIGAKHQHEIIVANTDKEVGDALVSYLQRRVSIQDIGNKAQHFIYQHYSWDAIFNKIDHHLLNLQEQAQQI